MNRRGGPDQEEMKAGSGSRRVIAQSAEELDEEFDYHGTSRKQYENAVFNGLCSEVLPGLLYLGSDVVARDYDKLKDSGVTHVINCAADYSADYHIDKGIKYLSYHLKDHVRENIECCFYESIDFINDAKKSGGGVFIHCVQGISRSSTLCLCYMILTQKISMEDGLKFIREKRQIANPNMTFLSQLIWFYKRLYGDYGELPVSPRIFLLSSH